MSAARHSVEEASTGPVVAATLTYNGNQWSSLDPRLDPRRANTIASPSPAGPVESRTLRAIPLTNVCWTFTTWR